MVTKGSYIEDAPSVSWVAAAQRKVASLLCFVKKSCILQLVNQWLLTVGFHLFFSSTSSRALYHEPLVTKCNALK